LTTIFYLGERRDVANSQERESSLWLARATPRMTAAIGETGVQEHGPSRHSAKCSFVTGFPVALRTRNWMSQDEELDEPRKEGGSAAAAEESNNSHS
jgi:hypothetical protein